MSTASGQSMANPIAEKQLLNKRLETLGWGLFLILSGSVWFVPGWQVPEAIWLTGVGVIILGLNLLRFLNGIEPASFGIILGISALFVGLAGLVSLSVPFLPVLFILLGGYILFRALSQASQN